MILNKNSKMVFFGFLRLCSAVLLENLRGKFLNILMRYLDLAPVEGSILECQMKFV